MLDPLDRRAFLAAGSALAAGVAFADGPKATPNGFKKAVKYYMVQPGRTLLEKFTLLKKLGFDGVELDSPNAFKLEDVLEAKKKTGLEIPGVVDSDHWKDTHQLGSPDAASRARGVESLRKALRDAKDYGATSVLLVPANVKKDVSYADAYRRSQDEIRKVLPLCKELNVKIALENVWNNFLLSPLETARYVDELGTEFVGVHFDVGNVVLYGWPEHWIATLGRRILKLDVKEFSRGKCDREGRWKGFGVPLLKGDCDWPAVMRALKQIKYVGWGAAEIPGGDEKYLAGVAADMDTIFGY